MSVKLDLVGLKCPLPVIRLEKAIKRAANSDVLELKVTDPMAKVDIPDFCERKKHIILNAYDAEDCFVFVIQKRSLPDSIRIETLVGSDMEKALDGLAALRIQVFQEWPYLYEGNLEHEKNYIKTFAKLKHAALIGAFDHEKLVGAATCSALVEQDEWVLKAFEGSQLDLQTLFYFGESVLDQSYRGLGLGHVFFDERERFARQFEHITTSCFCAVERSDEDPRKPAEYRNLHKFWRSRGYSRAENIKANLQWPEGQTKEMCSHNLQFWLNSSLR